MNDTKSPGLLPKLLLIQPPIHDFALYDHYLKPYGLLRLGRWFSEGGWDVDFLDCLDFREPVSAAKLGQPVRKSNGTGKFFRTVIENPLKDKPVPRRFARYGILPQVIDRRIEAASPDLVLITTGMTYWYRGVKEAVERVRKIYPDVPVAAGGIYASLMPEHCLEACGVDIAVPGEGRKMLSDFLVKYGLPVPEGSVPGRPMILPGIWKNAGIIRINRGCPFNCDYCASRKISEGFHQGAPGEAFDALMEIYRFSGTKNFAFYDDALLFKKEDVFHPFLELVLESGLNLNLYTPNAVHLKYLDEVTARMMVKAGFKEIRLGYESSSEEFHWKRDGKFDPRSFPGKIEELIKAGFSPENIRVYILAGLPGQKASDVEKSVMFARKSGVSISLAEYSPVPDSPMWEESCTGSVFPLKEEPLYHNNTFFPMEWDGFTREDLERIKLLTRSGIS